MLKSRLSHLRCRHPWHAAIRRLRDDGDNESNKDRLDLFLETENKRLRERNIMFGEVVAIIVAAFHSENR
ncbi:hypothetical protein Tco_0620429 [Tanacetum coccineum]